MGLKSDDINDIESSSYPKTNLIDELRQVFRPNKETEEKTFVKKIIVQPNEVLQSVQSCNGDVELNSSKSPKDLKNLVNKVCYITESPFRILKMSAQGNIKEVERLLNAKHNRLQIQDAKGWTPLHHAAANSQSNIIDFLVKKGADVNAVDNAGCTPLHVSVIHEAIHSIDQLIKCGANTSTKDAISRTPLHLAVYLNKCNVIEALLSHKIRIDLKAVDDEGKSALHIAARYDFGIAAKLLLSAYDFCPNQPCNNGFYPIHVAAKNASVGVLEALLQWSERKECSRKLMITQPDLEGNMPLHLAVHGGEIKAVELCLHNGASISWQQHDNSTPVHLACSQGAFDIVKLMFRMQPEEKLEVLDTQDAQGMTPLHCAAMFNHSDLVEFLLQEGASVNKVDKEHRTPLLLAASQKCWKSVEILLNNGADPTICDVNSKNILHVVIMNGGRITDIFCFKQPSAITPQMIELLNDQDKCGCSPMHYASKTGQIGSLTSLIQLGASVRVKNTNNESPLHFAARYGRYNTVKQLLNSINGFLIMNESDGNGKTAVHIASEEGHTRVLQLLLSKGALLHRDYQGRTPLHLASEGGHVDTMNALLTVWRHLLDQKDKDGNTALHLAAKNNKPAAISHLLFLGCKVLENNLRFKPIDYAIQLKLHEAAIAIVTHEKGEWHSMSDVFNHRLDLLTSDNSRMETCQSPSEIHGCVCIALIRTLPKVFEAALNQAITRADVKEDSKDYYVSHSFHPLQMNEEQIEKLASVKKDPNWRPPPLFSCNAMVQSGRVDLLMHPLTQKYLEMKWHAYGMHIHLLNLFVYLIYLSMVTLFAASVLGHNSSGDKENNRNLTNLTSNEISLAKFNETLLAKSTEWNNESILYVRYDTCSVLLAIGILSFCSLGFIKEFFQLYQQKLKYLADVMHIIEWVLYATSICMVLPILMDTTYSEQQYNSAAVAVLTAWFTLLLYFQRFDHIGIYIVMFLEILNTLLKVLAVFSVLIVAFGLAFYILLSHGNHLAYSNIPLTMVRTFSMMLGEIDFMNSFVYPFYQESARGSDIILRFPKTTFVLLVVFMILMPILLMNLLIGLAVGDIESVKKNAQLKRIAMQVDLHTGLENKLPTWLIKKVNRQDVVIFPNSRNANREDSRFHRFLNALDFFTPFAENEADIYEGTAEDIFFDEMENQKRRYKDIQGQLEQQLKLMKLIMQKMEIQNEADETDEGVSFDDLSRPPRQIRRWNSASSTRSASSRKLTSLSIAE